MRKSLDESQSREFVFLSLKGNEFSRSKNYHNGLLKSGYKSHWVDIDSNRKLSQLLDCKKQYSRKNTTFVVASPSHILVFFARLALRQKVCLDSGWPLFDGVVLSRGEYGFLGLRALSIYLMDLFAFQFSSLIFLESSAQVDSVRSKYFIPKSKLVALETGFDENRVIKKKESKVLGKPLITVLFRGGAQLEAGLEVLIDAIKILRDRSEIRFIVASRGLKVDGKNLKNVTVYDEYLSDEELWKLYGSADIVLGQLSKHARLHKTLPHKFYEAGYFRKCYLTSNLGAISTFIEKGLAVGFLGGDSQSLVEAITGLAKKKSLRNTLGRNLGNYYESNFSQEALVMKLLSQMSR